MSYYVIYDEEYGYLCERDDQRLYYTPHLNKRTLLFTNLEDAEKAASFSDEIIDTPYQGGIIK